MRRAIILAALASLAACGGKEREADPAEDARAVAMVEKMSTPPVIPIMPREITAADIERNDLSVSGCAFVLPSDKDPIFLAGQKLGWLKLDGRIVELTSDRSSDEMPYGTWTKYIGLENWLTLSRAAAEERTDDPAAATRGEIVIHDANEKVVFRARGSIRCNT